MEDAICVLQRRLTRIAVHTVLFYRAGVTMLSCILNSDRAIEVNIQIIRIFQK